LIISRKTKAPINISRKIKKPSKKYLIKCLENQLTSKRIEVVKAIIKVNSKIIKSLNVFIG